MRKKQGELKKSLGSFDVFSIASGAMISSGLFILPAIAFTKTGPAVILSYLLAAIFVIPAMFSKAELATAMPKSGGTYFFVDRSLGSLFGTFAGLANWFSLSLKTSFALVGIGVFIAPLISDSPEMVKIVAIGFALFFAILNISSIKHGGRFQIVFVMTLISLLLFFIFSGIRSIRIEHFTPFEPFGPMSVFSTAGMIFISFGGLTKIACVAEEVKKPGKSIPRGMFSAFFVVTLLYVLAVFVTVGVLPGSEFSATLTPLSTAANRFLGKPGFFAMEIAALLAFLTTANAGIMAASRDPMAMSRDNLLPGFFSRINIKTGTPVLSILFTSSMMILFITVLDLEQLVKVASTMKLLLFTMVNIALVFMRASRMSSYKPKFHAPLAPYLQIAGAIVYIILIFNMGKLPLIMTGGFFLFATAWYLLYSKRRINKDSALLRVVERITSKDIRSSGLAEELREILIKRDDIIEDRFDTIIREAHIFDIEGKADLEDLFDALADGLSPRLGVPKEEIITLLREREAQSTTAIHPGLAIPHIVVDGTGQFDIMVIRSKEGIFYGEGIAPVHIVFALAGSRDERNFHLQALMAIAQIVQNPDFFNNWVKADSTEDLLNLILLAERSRRGDV
ncbi:MAG: amino acid permease [Spirochaetales bacterium]|nr:amino acid permease [Spirochaetales bacterium]